MYRKLMTTVAGLAALAMATLMVSVTPAAAGAALGGVQHEGYSDNSTSAEDLTTRIEFYNCGRCTPVPRYPVLVLSERT
jgi:hypothetical protein